MVIFSFLKFAQNPRTCVAQLDCIKTKWKLSWQVIIKDSQNHWTNHFCAFNHNKINFMSQTLPLIELTGILAWTSVRQGRCVYLLNVYSSRIQDSQNWGIHVFWWELCGGQYDQGTVCTSHMCASTEQKLVGRKRCQICGEHKNLFTVILFIQEISLILYFLIS